jgi:hypothetical protein
MKINIIRFLALCRLRTVAQYGKNRNLVIIRGSPVTKQYKEKNWYKETKDRNIKK